MIFGLDWRGRGIFWGVMKMRNNSSQLFENLDEFIKLFQDIKDE